MTLKEWLYIAPQRIRRGVLAQPSLVTWDEVEALNMQRFARVLEMQGCVAFIGSGTSNSRGYPGWKDLLPTESWTPKPETLMPVGIPMDAEHLSALRDNLKAGPYQKLLNTTKNRTIDDFPLSPKLSALLKEEVAKDKATAQTLKNWLKVGPDIGMSQLLQMAEQRLTCSGVSGRVALINFLHQEFQAAEKKPTPNKPLGELMKYPIYRYVTTNYDHEIERELKEVLGHTFHESDKSFGQDDSEKLAKFVISLAKINRYMVFHCHGRLSDELARLKNVQAAPSPEHARRFRHSALVLTDEDYNYWYLASSKKPNTFQTCMQVLSQSTPLFFVGYSLQDFDVVRELRSVTLRKDTDRLASNSFVLLSDQPEDTDEVKIARQIKNGVNLLSYKRRDSGATDGRTLDEELNWRRIETERLRRRWRLQPKARILGFRPTGILQPHTVLDPVSAAGEETRTDLLLSDVPRTDGSWLDAVYQSAPPRQIGKTQNATVLLGPAGSAKLMKLSKLARASPADEKWIVFHAYNNDDIYSYIKRIEAGVCKELGISVQSEDPIGHLIEILRDPALGEQKLYVAISNLDLFLDMSGYHPDEPQNAPESGDPQPSSEPEDPQAAPDPEEDMRSREQSWSPRNEFSKRLLETIATFAGEKSANGRLIITMRTLPPKWTTPGPSYIDISEICPIDRYQLQLKEDEYAQLNWLLKGEEGGLIIAAAYIDSRSGSSREQKLKGILRELRSHPYDRGARVVRYIVRELGADSQRLHEHVLTFLSCFNAPVTREIVCGAMDCCEKFLRCKPFSPDALLHTLVSYRLVEAIQEAGEKNPASLKFVVTPLAKRFCRLILEQTQHPEMRAHGVHGLFSRGPFNSPGNSSKARLLFDHFANSAYERISKALDQRPGSVDSSQDHIRAILDILRSNFACNSVPLWGKYRDYIEMLSFAIDLVRNNAIRCDEAWMPGETGSPAKDLPRGWESAGGIVSAEDMIYLYNELGLAYYHTGAIQDALSVWGLAVDWQKVLREQNKEQAIMYEASLYAHITMGYLQMGRMESANHFRRLASAAARKTGNSDLNSRMFGMEGRFNYFAGDIPEAKAIFKRVVASMRRIGNRRGESYFMRLWAALELSYGNAQKAEDLARESLALASSVNAPDLAAFSSELLARVFNKNNKTQEAIKEYRIALAEAKRMDISRLRADILLGLARIQLKLGDPRAAHLQALEALILANEHLLVVRQIKALILLGQSIATLGNEPLGISLLTHAQSLAANSRFRTAEHEAQEAISQLNITSGAQPG